MKKLLTKKILFIVATPLIVCAVYIFTISFSKVSEVESHFLDKALDGEYFAIGSYVPKIYTRKLEVQELEKASDYILYECTFQKSSSFLTSITLYDRLEFKYLDINLSSIFI